MANRDDIIDLQNQYTELCETNTALQIQFLDAEHDRREYERVVDELKALCRKVGGTSGTGGNIWYEDAIAILNKADVGRYKVAKEEHAYLCPYCQKTFSAKPFISDTPECPVCGEAANIVDGVHILRIK